jgi:dGTPase
VICSKTKIYDAKVVSLDDVKQAPTLISFTDATAAASLQLKKFLKAELYSHPSVNSKMAHAKAVVSTLFEMYEANPKLMPEDHAENFEARGMRAIADYIAGMTDRFALREYEKLGLGEISA